jgi:hypothetical protein
MRSKDSLANLSEQQLLTRFGDLVSQDRRHTAQLLATLAEIDERKLWAKHACPSMFAFCMERFHMSESMTAKRIWAARTARRFPVILQMVSRGELHLSAIVRLAKHLTPDNHHRLLTRAKHKSSREIDLLVAELAPQPDVPSRIRALPRATGSVAGLQPRPADAYTSRGPRQAEEGCSPAALDSSSASNGSDGSGGSDGSNASRGPNAFDPPTAPTTPNSPMPRGRVVPLAPRRYKIEITVDQQTHDKLRMLEDLLGHQLAGADPAIIVSRAIDRLLNDTLKKKAAVTDDARQSDRRNNRRTRAIPAVIRREVWQRDAGRCTFVDQQGRRCRGTRCVEYHHEKPYGKGGQHEADNIALRCRAHNQYQADLDFGKDFMRGKRRSNNPHSARHV